MPNEPAKEPQVREEKKEYSSNNITFAIKIEIGLAISSEKVMKVLSIYIYKMSIDGEVASIISGVELQFYVQHFLPSSLHRCAR